MQIPKEVIEEKLDKSIELLVKEEVNLPEMLTGKARIDNGEAMAQMAKKINDILVFLASKENK